MAELQKLGDVSVGTIVKLNVSGQPTNFIVVNQGKPSDMYDDSCDGTWVCLEDLYSTRTWDSSNNDYKNSDIHAWLNNDFLKLFDPDIQAAIKQVKIPYVNGTGGSAVASGANGLSCKIFLLSGYELGWTKSDNSYFPVDGAKLDYFTAGTSSAANQKRIAKYNGSATSWWTRSPYTSGSGFVWDVNSDGYCSNWNFSNAYGVRPAFVLPSTLLVSDDGTVSTNEHPTAPGSIEVSNTVSGGEATVTITPATDPDGTISNYVYERSVDGGEFTPFATVNSLTQTDHIDEGWGTIAYRVCAVDNVGASGPYVTSETYTINSGWLLIGGPASNLGIKSKKFDFKVTIGVSGETGITDINVVIKVDGKQLYDDSVNQDESISLTIDTRTFGSGQHDIQVIATKEDYLSAAAGYVFTVPSIALPDGGYSAVAEDSNGNPIFYVTTARNVIGANGMSVQSEIDQINKSHRGITGHLEFIDSVLGAASYELTREENTTYAVQLFAPADSATTFSMVSVHSGFTGSIGDYLTVDAEKLTFTLANNSIMSVYKYVLDNAVDVTTDPSVRFIALSQPKVSVANTNTGVVATDLTDALNQIITEFPTYNYYLITDSEGTISYYIASQGLINDKTQSVNCSYVASNNPQKWYRNVNVQFTTSE